MVSDLKHDKCHMIESTATVAKFRYHQLSKRRCHYLQLSVIKSTKIINAQLSNI